VWRGLGLNLVGIILLVLFLKYMDFSLSSLINCGALETLAINFLSPHSRCRDFQNEIVTQSMFHVGFFFFFFFFFFFCCYGSFRKNVAAI